MWSAVDKSNAVVRMLLRASADCVPYSRDVCGIPATDSSFSTATYSTAICGTPTLSLTIQCAPHCCCLQVVREQLPSNKVNLTITVPGSICQEGFTETVKIMRRCGTATTSCSRWLFSGLCSSCFAAAAATASRKELAHWQCKARFYTLTCYQRL